MVFKFKKETAGKREKINVLNLNKEIVRNQSRDEADGVKGGTGSISAHSIVSSIRSSASGRVA